MELQLNDIEVRVLGCLIEKEMTTPEYYPLSLNALTNACNQKSNRDPVMNLDETDIIHALDSLRFKGLAMQTSNEGSRVPRYQHNLSQKLYLESDELAILCELLVRGPQTVGELRNRGERMYPLPSLESVEKILLSLSDREVPLVTKLPRQTGRKESRFCQTMSPLPPPDESAGDTEPETARRFVNIQEQRIQTLEEEVANLKTEISAIAAAFTAFQEQFK